MFTAYRIIAVAVAIAIIVCVIVSCSSDKDGEADVTTTLQITEAVTEPPTFKEKDLGGDEITFLTYNEHATKYVDSYITPDTETGDVISEAVSARNAEVENKFNVKIVSDTVYSPKNEAISRIHSGQCDFDVIYEWGTVLSTLALDGQLCNLEDVSTVHLDRNYWVPEARDDLTVGGKMYIATNYVTMNSIDWASMIYFNKSMYTELGNTDSLYDHVLYGTWTFDKYVDAAISAIAEINGDGNMTALDDRFGIWGDSVDCISGLVRSSGLQNTVKNDDGSYSLDVYNEKAVDIYTDFADMLEKQNAFVTYEDVWQEQPDLTDFASRAEGGRYVGFGEEHVLFMPGTLSIAHEFTDMEDDFGILPNPRYSAEQEDFYHFVDCNAPMFALPADGENTNNTGLVLEYMAYESEQELLPVYAKLVTESKKNPDPMDKVMFEIIKNSVRYDWTELYELEVTNTILDKMIVSGSFKSVYSRLYSKAKAEIDGCIDTLSFIGIE